MDEWGIEDGYDDVDGQWHPTPAPTRTALRVAMGGLADVADPPPLGRPVWFVRQGSGPSLQRGCELVLEDGTRVGCSLSLPEDLPLGYHDLHPDDGGPVTRLIITPDRCHLPERMRTWAWAVQLYGARSAASWGIGDLGDLRQLGRWARGQGAGMLAVNPLHAPLPLEHQESSPYFPSSRLFRNPLYLRVEDVDGFDAADTALATLAGQARALNQHRIIDRDRAHGLKQAALELLWERFVGDPRFDAFVAEQGNTLARYTAFVVLCEFHGRGWHRWPAEHRRPESPAVQRFVAAHADRARFHAWCQWLLDEQLAAAGAEIDLLGDLAVGVDPDGFDAWLWQDVFARGARVGAPPDEFNPAGQNWGIPPFVPWRLRSLGYEPLARTLRAAMRHCGALRLDHVTGLFRLFWIPSGGGSHDGSYVRFPGTELLGVVALESARSGTVMIGEDLGTVEDDVRSHLAGRGVLSYRLAWFEDDPPEQYPAQALAAVTTHDLPTVAGVWSGEDDDDRLRARLTTLCADALAGAGAATPVTDVVLEAHRRLAAAPSMVVVGTLEDALAVTERPNVPGTTDSDRPNWSISLPVPLEDVFADENVEAIATALGGQSGLV
ncbi:MAG: 4-alpha-glucanotransferase [Acidimicrobiia bacterium]